MVIGNAISYERIVVALFDVRSLPEVRINIIIRYLVVTGSIDIKSVIVIVLTIVIPDDVVVGRINIYPVETVRFAYIA